MQKHWILWFLLYVDFFFLTASFLALAKVWQPVHTKIPRFHITLIFLDSSKYWIPFYIAELSILFFFFFKVTAFQFL